MRRTPTLIGPVVDEYAKKTFLSQILGTQQEQYNLYLGRILVYGDSSNLSKASFY